jgi:predicted transglutaminase-like cysteine proteinase
MFAFAAMLAAFAAEPAASQPRTRLLYVSVGESTRVPPGWVQFCKDRPSECSTGAAEPQNKELTDAAMRELEQVNHSVNKSIRSVTDLKHYGVVEKWTYPDDGAGDCEDYALLKRKMLIGRGWPRSSLLMTIVRNSKGSHAILTVRTDKGEFVLDNLNNKVLPWTSTGYRFIKRQSQTDQNIWVSLSHEPTPLLTAQAKPAAPRP